RRGRLALDLRELLVAAREPLLALVHLALAGPCGLVAGLDRLLPRREALGRVAFALGGLCLGALEARLTLLQLAFLLLLLRGESARLALQPLIRVGVLAGGRLGLRFRGLELLALPVGLAVALLRSPLGLLQFRPHRVELAASRLRCLRTLAEVALLLDEATVALVQ